MSDESRIRELAEQCFLCSYQPIRSINFWPDDYSNVYRMRSEAYKRVRIWNSPQRIRSTGQWQISRVRSSFLSSILDTNAKTNLFSGDVVCEEPLLTVDRQMGLNIVHPEGKPAKTVFRLIRYDENTDTSVVHCKPMTGRCKFSLTFMKNVPFTMDLLAHQLRVHLQYLGHPISNDPVYGDRRIWVSTESSHSNCVTHPRGC